MEGERTHTTRSSSKVRGAFLGGRGMSDCMIVCGEADGEEDIMRGERKGGETGGKEKAEVEREGCR